MMKSFTFYLKTAYSLKLSITKLHISRPPYMTIFAYHCITLFALLFILHKISICSMAVDCKRIMCCFIYPSIYSHNHHLKTEITKLYGLQIYHLWKFFKVVSCQIISTSFLKQQKCVAKLSNTIVRNKKLFAYIIKSGRTSKKVWSIRYFVVLQNIAW